MEDNQNNTEQSATTLINGFISKFSDAVSTAIGQEIAFDNLDADGFTSISRGSITVGINVVESEDVLIFVAKIMNVPETKELECYRFLLELNYLATSDGAFAIDKASNSIVLRAHRSTDGLDYEEFEQMLNSVATVADEWDDRLLAEFS